MMYIYICVCFIYTITTIVPKSVSAVRSHLPNIPGLRASPAPPRGKSGVRMETNIRANHLRSSSTKPRPVPMGEDAIWYIYIYDIIWYIYIGIKSYILSYHSCFGWKSLKHQTWRSVTWQWNPWIQQLAGAGRAESINQLCCLWKIYKSKILINIAGSPIKTT